MRKLLFFHVSWCPPCRFYDREIIMPLEKSIEADRIIRVNVEKNPFQAEKYGVDKLPMIVILDNEEVILQSTGGYTANKLAEIMDKGGDVI